MNRDRRTFIRALESVLAGLTAFAGAVCCLGAQDPGRVVDYVSPSLLSSTAARTTGPVAPDPRILDERVMAAPPYSLRSAEERRLDFEREYGIEQDSHSWFFSMLRSAKYGLDKMAFTAKETAKRLEFTYDIGSPTGPSGVTVEPQYSLPLFGTFGQPQIKSVLTEHDPQTGTPFIGLKLAVPFGGRE